MGRERRSSFKSSLQFNEMKKLLEFIIGKITDSNEFTVEESMTEDGKTNLTVATDPSVIGIVIGKDGKTIKNIRRILAIKGVLENKSVNISVIEK